VTLADLILINNHLMEAIAKFDSEINDDYDLWASLSTLKDGFLKYCKAYDNRLRHVLQDIRVLPEDEEESTVVNIKGIILAWKSRLGMSRQTLSEMSVETQFLFADKAQYSELSQDFASISFSPKSKTALENLRMLVMLDLKILLGADIKWRKPVGTGASGNGSAAAAAASGNGGLSLIPVLGDGRGDDDADDSSEDGTTKPTRKEAAARAGPAAAATRAPGPATAATAAAKEVVDAQQAKAADADAQRAKAADAAASVDAVASEESAVDAQKADAEASEKEEAAAATRRGSDDKSTLDDFTTWTHETWDLLDFSQVSFPPATPVVHIKNHYALALLFCHSKSLREKFPECYKALCTAWEAHFCRELNSDSLGTPPRAGPYAYTPEEQEWCEQTLRFFNAGSAAPKRARVTAAAASAAAEPRRSERSQPAKPVANKAPETSISRSMTKKPKASEPKADGEGGMAVIRRVHCIICIMRN